ncbi:MAG: autotransporter domain-containing protein, partial [bacterium]|nr:autotransporter domain-containing protein [bacterium]
AGTGTLGIFDGGVVTSPDGYVGYDAGSVGAVTLSGEYAEWTSGNYLAIGYNGTGTLDVSNGAILNSFNGDIGSGAGSDGTVTVSGALSLWANSNSLVIGNSGTGTLTVSGGTVTVNDSGGNINLAVIPGSTGILNIGEGGTAGAINAAAIVGGGGTATVNFNHGNSSYIFAPDITGSLNLNHTGAGTTVLAGNNVSYTGNTIISAGILNIHNDRTLTGNMTLSGGTLDIGANTLNLGTDYTQGANSNLKINIANSVDAGTITATGNADVAADSVLDISVTGYVTDGAAYTIIDGAAGSGLVNVPGTIRDNSAVLTFAGSTDTDDLTLTAKRANTYNGLAGNSNQSAAGSALETAGSTNATEDMINILGQLDSLSSQTAVQNALSQVTPSVDAGVITTSFSTLAQSMGMFTGHLSDMRRGLSGVSTGDSPTGVNIWVKGFGNYANQDKRDHIDGYTAWTGGTALGMDFLSAELLRIGFGGGYAFSKIDSKQQNIGDTDIHSYQAVLYGGYENGPFYLDTAGSFAYNRYESSRTVTFGNISRTADSDYNGQQYSAYIGGGYIIDAGNFEVTPLASLRYIRLHLEDYREKGADALNLKVDSKDYDMLQSGLGLKIAYPIKTVDVTCIIDAHGMWLYDFIGDKQQSTSTFTGGGPSFKTQGADPAQHSFDIGAGLTVAAINDISLSFIYDFEIKEDFYAHSGTITVKYSF